MVGQVDGHREDDGGVVLSRDAVQSLEVAQLKQGSQVNAHKSVNKYFHFNGFQQKNIKTECKQSLSS